MKYLFACLVIFFLAVLAGVFLVKQTTPQIFESPLGNGTAISIEQLRSNPIVYGYLPYWNLKKAQYPQALTHVSFFSLPIQPDGHILTPSQDQGYRKYAAGILEDLKASAPHAALELTLTMMDQDSIPTFLASPSATTNLISDTKEVMRTTQVTGVNIDVEYIRGVDSAKRAQFTQMMKNFYTSMKSVNPKFHVSVAVLADSVERERLTDIPALVPFTDHIIIMAYDFHRKNSVTTGANSPLYGNTDESWGKNVMSSSKGFTDVVPASKLILGVPFYGYEWSVTSDNPYNFTLPDSGAVATYDRITKLLASGKATRHWDNTSFTPYLLYTDKGQQQQIYYEDAQSLGFKLDLVKQAGFGGIAIWAMGYEGPNTELWDTIGKAFQK